MTLGVFQNDLCDGWTFHSNIKNSRVWMVKAQQVNITNHAFEDINIYIDGVKTQGIILPYRIRKQLLLDNVLIEDRSVDESEY